jgi:hypothetical protein
MARARAKAGQGDTLAGEAWAAGCRDVQAAINWAAGKGAVAGPPFQAAFRRLLSEPDADPPVATPPVPTAADPGAGPTGGRSRRDRRGDRGRTEPRQAASSGADNRTTGRKPEGNGRVVGGPAPVPAAPKGAGSTSDPNPGTPAEFVEDMRTLRHLLAKYGKKGLADLIGMLAG